MAVNDLSAPSALIIAHPGHELRLHGWVARVKPAVFVLTDGSGHTGKSRLDSTTATLNEVGAEPGCIYGRLTDKALYAAVLDHNFEVFIELTEELARALVRNRVACVAGDAMEGYNPSHDICRVIANAAVKLASRASGHEIGNFDFLLAGRPDSCPGGSRDSAVCLHLDSQELNHKLAAARRYTELFTDVNEALGRWGEESFQTECLRPAGDGDEQGLEVPPFYEGYGEKQVENGYYASVLRYREHFLPVAEAIRRHVEGKV